MTTFVTKVELHEEEHGPKADYEKLHTAMIRSSFKRIIRADSGDYYWMPHATYLYESETKTSEQVRDRAKNASGTVWNDCRILTVASEDYIAFENLRPATAQDYAKDLAEGKTYRDTQRRLRASTRL